MSTLAERLRALIGEPQTVLVADENRQMVKMCRQNLESFGCRIIVAAQGNEALAKARQHQPDVLLISSVLREIDGVEVTRSLRSETATSQMPIILVTPESSPEARVRGLESGADDVISQPVSAPELRAKILNLLRIDRYRSLRNQQKQRRPLLGSIPLPLLSTNMAGSILWANQKMCHLLDVTHPGDLIQSHWTKWLRTASEDHLHQLLSMDLPEDNTPASEEPAAIVKIKAVTVRPETPMNSNGGSDEGNAEAANQPVKRHPLHLSAVCGRVDWDGRPALIWFFRDVTGEDPATHTEPAMQDDAQPRETSQDDAPAHDAAQSAATTALQRDFDQQQDLLQTLQKEFGMHLETMLNTARVMEDGRLGDISDEQQRGLQKIETKCRHLLTILNDLQPSLRNDPQNKLGDPDAEQVEEPPEPQDKPEEPKTGVIRITKAPLSGK